MRAQLTRRELVAGTATVPAIVIAAPEACSATAAWDRALVAYRTARGRHEEFLANVLDPEARATRTQGPGLTARVVQLEEHGNELYGRRHEALRALIFTRADDVESLRMKMRLAYDEVFRFEDTQGYLAAILTDFERMLE